MKKTATDPQCGTCLFWKAVEQSGPVMLGVPARGVCFGAPPQMLPTMRDGRVEALNMRPMLPDSDPACSLYVDADELQDYSDPAH
jgi:hypothetical protein